MKSTHLFAAVIAAASATLPALAADDHKGHDHDAKGGEHAHEAKALNGGAVTVLRDVNYELVAKTEAIALYVSDHGKPVDLRGASARVTLLSASDKTDVTLAPAGGRLEAKGSYKVAAGAKAVAVVTLPGKAPVTVKFTVK